MDLAPQRIENRNAPQTVELRSRAENEKGAEKLAQRWAEHAQAAAVNRSRPQAEPSSALLTVNMVAESHRQPAPQQRLDLALASTAEYVEPTELRSQNGVLRATLKADYAVNSIGKDPVRLRNFNDKLVGPTLRVKQGEKICLTLNNDLPGERWQKNMMNTLHSFNTINLHFHGLHVSPNGISDNVLIEVGPHESQYYELDIPIDHPTGTFWYHPHRHGSTAATVASGMSGALIIEPKDDKVPSLDNVPQVKAAKERVMVLNQIPYLKDNVFYKKDGTIDKAFSYSVGQIESSDQDYMFGPGTWTRDGMDRYTTVNGVQVPNITMSPGEIQRWRIVDSAMREAIHLKIVNCDGTKAPISVHEIAVDGLALGRIEEKHDHVELWPGYRSDVLVHCHAQQGEFLLINDASNDTLSGAPKELTYVARIRVTGSPMDMHLPKNSDLKGLDLGTISDGEVTGYQTARYGILLVGGVAVFTIDGKSFDMETARTLTLGDVEEWTLTSVNDVGKIPHPFHIHVNPFLVTSIMERENGILREKCTHPVWRDNIKIPGDGYVKMRTRYQDFIGTFVQHCHILDHEDQGMMQLIDIRERTAPQPPPLPLPPSKGAAAPTFTLPDAQGVQHSLEDLANKPRTVLFFFKGHACLHCVLQVTAFKEHFEDFKNNDIRVVGITSDDVESLRKALADAPMPFHILADPKGDAFKAYGCVAPGGLLHGTFMLDALRKVAWLTVGTSPYLAVKTLLEL